MGLRRARFRKRRKRSRSENTDTPPFKKRATEEDNLAEKKQTDEYEEVEEKVSAYEMLLSSLPVAPAKEFIEDAKPKKEKKEITMEDVEMDEDSEISVRKVKEVDLDDFVVEETEKNELKEKSDDEESSEEVEEDEDETDQSNYTMDHFNEPISGEQVELLAKGSQNKFEKSELVVKINDLLREDENSQTAMYAPICPEFDRSKSESIEPLPTSHMNSKKKIKKEIYIESLKDLFLKKKLRESFQNEIGKYINSISKHRKQLLSAYEGTFPVESNTKLVKTFSLLLPIFNQYYDVLFSLETLFNAEIVRLAYMLHVVNHIIKVRTTITLNSQKLHSLQKQEKDIKRDMKFCEREYWSTRTKKGKKIPPALQSKLDEFEVKLREVTEKQSLLNEKIQDQGFTRPRTLILVPTQEMAGSLVELLMSLYPVSQIHHRKRFYEYFLPKDRDLEPHSYRKPDYNAMFHGNTNDTFYICIKTSQRLLKLFADPYDSDIIIASPIGLRAMIDKKADRRGRHDFLSSIEICILDLSDVFLMQNWSHVEFIVKHLNEIPELSRDTDFSRVKPYFLEGWFVDFLIIIIFYF